MQSPILRCIRCTMCCARVAETERPNDRPRRPMLTPRFNHYRPHPHPRPRLRLGVGGDSSRQTETEGAVNDGGWSLWGNPDSERDVRRTTIRNRESLFRPRFQTRTNTGGRHLQTQELITRQRVRGYRPPRPRRCTAGSHCSSLQPPAWSSFKTLSNA